MSSQNQNGLGFLGLLTIVLIVIKLLGLTSISWWLVFGPMWIPIAALAAVVVIGALVVVAFTVVPDMIDEFRRRRAQRRK